MVLERNRSLGLISVLTLGLAFGCSSKKEGDSGGTGGAAFCTDPGNCGTAGATATGGASTTTVDPNYCNGLLSGQTCGQTNLQADVRTVNMLLVIDESGSMSKPPSATDAQTKWAQMTQALQGVLPSFAADINFGLLMYPNNEGASVDTTSADTSCVLSLGGGEPAAVNVDIAPGADNLQLITDTVAAATPAGGTPTAKALTRALAYYTTGAGRDLKGSKWVLLATDGGPNCDSNIGCEADSCTQNLDGLCATGVNCCEVTTSTPNANLSCLDEAEVIKQINQLKAVGVSTYVIGIPGSEAYAATLDNMANAGGVPNPAGVGGHTYYAVSAGNALQDLKDAFSGIITQLVKTCDITLTSTPGDPATVQAVQDCELIPRLTDPTSDAGTGGFYINYNESPAHLVLTGTYCDRILTLGANRLDIIEGCRSIQ